MKLCLKGENVEENFCTLTLGGERRNQSQIMPTLQSLITLRLK